MKLNAKKMLALVGVILFAPSAWAVTCPGPDAFGYTCTDDPAGCSLEPTCTTVTPTLSDDDCETRNLGFTGQFYGNTFTQVGIGSNGYLLAGSCASGDGTDFSNDCPVPSATDPNNAIFGVWDDLNPSDGGTVSFCTNGTAPNRVFVAEWEDVPFFATGGADTTTFQIQIFEAPAGEESPIRVNIQNADETDYTSGLENMGGSDGISRFCNDGTTGAQCTEYSTEAAPPTGTCDLTPVLNAIELLEEKADMAEVKLDDNAAAIATAIAQGEANADAIASARAEIALIEGKVDLIETKFDELPCEIFRTFNDDIPTTHPCYIP